METKLKTDDALARDVSSVGKTDEETSVVPVIEEQATFGKRIVETGRVRVSKRVNEREETFDVPLLHEKVSVERVPINQYVDQLPEVRHEGDVMIIPVVREHLVTQKRLVLVEELRVRKEVIETHQPESVTLREETVEVVRISDDQTT